MTEDTQQEPQIQYCIDQVNQYDHDRYLCIMLAPRNRRDDLFALHGFNCEIASIRSHVNETLLGQMRLQWWRDIIHNSKPDNPRPAGTAGLLYHIICRHGLAKQHFLDLLEARGDDLNDNPPPTLDSLVDYCAATSSTLVQLSLDMLSGSPSQKISPAAYHCGVAWALSGIIRSMAYQLAHPSQARCMVPMDMQRKTGIDLSDLSGLTTEHELKALRDIVRSLATRANEHLQHARQASKNQPRSTIAALLSVPLASHYLGRISKTGFDAFDGRLQHSHSPLKTLGLLFAGWCKKI